MKCENCGKNEANVKFTQIINGEKKQMFLCEDCSEKLGIDTNIHLNMPINFSSFLSDFFDDVNAITPMPMLEKELKCEKCGLTFDDFMNTGKFGCSNCFEEFEQRIDPILKNIHGSNRHIGRLGNVIEGNKISTDQDDQFNNSNNTSNIKNSNGSQTKNEKEKQIEDLKSELKLAIKEERYEDAAKIRDQIKQQENKDKTN